MLTGGMSERYTNERMYGEKGARLRENILL